MKIVQINVTYGSGSTGKIVADIDDVIKHHGMNSYIVSGYKSREEREDVYYFNTRDLVFETKKNLFISRLSGVMGYRHKKKTRDAIKWLESINPDIIHLHNIHGDWINLELLFDYIKRKGIPVVWTIHDCWAFTGRCSYFSNVKCYKWKTKCYDCNNLKIYPISYFFDNSEKMFTDKKRWFTNITDAAIITPSEWLAKNVKDSFLGKYSVEAIPSGIDLDIFYPRKCKSKYLYGIDDDKTIILGVASSWTKRKGLYDFYELDKVIDHNQFQIVLVGLNKKQVKEIPDTIIGISRTENQDELAEIYSSAGCYLNCSIMETMGMTTVEAMACGTPVVVFDETAVPETVVDNTGIVLREYDSKIVYEAIKKMCIEKTRITRNCVEHAKKNYNKVIQFEKYYEVYKRILK